jgi:hypothetical protein
LVKILHRTEAFASHKDPIFTSPVQAGVFNVRDCVAEPINENHLAFNAVAVNFRLRPRQADKILLRRTQFVNRHAAAQIRRDWGENVTPVERAAERMQKVFFVRKSADGFDFFPRQRQRQHAVVRPHEKIFRCLHRYGLARAADTRVYHHHMHRSLGKPAAARSQRERAPANIAGGQPVGEVHDDGARRETQNDVLHCAHEPVLRAEIRCQRDNLHAGSLT